MTTNHVTEQLPAYALGALDLEEKDMVVRHLAACPACQAELNTYLAVVTELPLMVPQVSPPARLRQAILERVAPQKPAEVRPGLGERLRRLFQPLSPAVALIGLVLIVALAASNIALWQQVQQIQQKPAPQAAAFTTLKLQSPATSYQASALMVISDGGQFGTLVADGLKPLEKSQQYQLWMIKAGQRTSGGLFNVNQDGYGALVITSPDSLLNYDSFGVTVEPAGGSPGPTGPKVLGGSY